MIENSEYNWVKIGKLLKIIENSWNQPKPDENGVSKMFKNW
jgi:hypothetical protein